MSDQRTRVLRPWRPLYSWCADGGEVCRYAPDRECHVHEVVRDLHEENKHLRGQMREFRAFLSLMVEGTEFYNPSVEQAAQRLLDDLGGPLEPLQRVPVTDKEDK